MVLRGHLKVTLGGYKYLVAFLRQDKDQDGAQLMRLSQYSVKPMKSSVAVKGCLK
jgi:hypothetical protein